MVKHLSKVKAILTQIDPYYVLALISVCTWSWYWHCNL